MIKVSLRDPVSWSKAWARRILTLRTATRKDLSAADSQSGFVQHVIETWERTRSSQDLGVQARTLWEIEHQSELFLKRVDVAGTLDDPRLSRALLPIAHVGAGMASVERVEFRPEMIRQEVIRLSAPGYRRFCFESVGAFLALYKKDAFFLASRLQARLGMVAMMDLSRGDPDRFMAGFPPSIQQLIAHGYGRMLYFKSFDLKTALRHALEFSRSYRKSLVRGIAFAYSFVNHADMGRTLGVGKQLEQSECRDAFDRGQTNLLVFWEWHYPGLLDRLTPDSRQAGKLIEAARREHSRNLLRGVPRAFPEH